MNEPNSVSSIVTTRQDAGFVVPIIGRTANSDVLGFPGFPLIRAGEQITREIAERAQAMGRLFELTAASEPKA
jgi:hypothetical protein